MIEYQQQRQHLNVWRIIDGSDDNGCNVPSGSKFAIGRLVGPVGEGWILRRPWAVGIRTSQRRNVLSMDDVKNLSSVGQILKLTTLLANKTNDRLFEIFIFEKKKYRFVCPE